ncbi:MAG: ribbon-helix-helix domain-containing protein [Planctomycetia bacterium]|nr:ribbon-helix-helix domain-containing protein [Planctomycetia bacterium]
MKTMTLELSEQLATDVDNAVKAGWFTDPQEAIRQAVREFLNSRRLQLQEQQQLEDVEWARRAAKR